MAKVQAARIDPDLRRQLESTAAGDAPVEAVLYLRPQPGQLAVPPERMDELAREILERAGAAAGEAAHAYNVFRNLGMVAVVGGRSFLRELLKQPEVSSAVANRQDGSAR